MMKKSLPVVLSSLLVVSSPLVAISVPQSVSAAESNALKSAPNESVELQTEYNVNLSPEEDYEIFTFVDPNEPKILEEKFENFNVGVQNPLNLIIDKKDQNSTNVVVPDGPVFTWEYVDTTYGNNVAYSKASTFLVNAFMAGLSATVLGKITSNFWAGSAGYALGTLTVPSGNYQWWTVKKWIDQDAYNIYFRYEIKFYSDSGRTKLIDTVTYVERAA